MGILCTPKNLSSMSAIKNICNTGLFISFEGIEGMGKSTQIDALCNYLTTKGLTTVRTREPGGSALGEDIRHCLLKSYTAPIDPLTELALLIAARRYHLNNIIKPALKKGFIVLSDRFTDASRAYQGYGRGLGLPLVNELHQRFSIDREPDCTILLDGPVGLSSKRLESRGHVADRIEQESHIFFEKVRAGYRALAAQEPERFFVVDANQDQATITHQICSHILTLLP